MLATVIIAPLIQVPFLFDVEINIIALASRP